MGGIRSGKVKYIIWESYFIPLENDKKKTNDEKMTIPEARAKEVAISDPQVPVLILLKILFRRPRTKVLSINIVFIPH